VYEFLGARDNAQFRLRPGLHATTADDLEVYFDFFDRVFGRGQAPVHETMIFGYTFEDWQKTTGVKSAPPVSGDPLQWALGPRPPQVPFAKPTHDRGRVLVSDGWMRAISPSPVDKSFKEVTVPLGVNVKADLFLPTAGRPGKRPVVIWLHAFNHARGYMHQARAPFAELARRGYAVLAFDQIGFGTRVEQAKDFYRRYPQWSLLGKMVADTRSAIAAMKEHPDIDPTRIYLVGYALGAQVALWTAAEDPAPRAVVAIAGITPLRTSGDREAIRMQSHLHGLLPRLGFYADTPAQLPFDYDDVLRRIGSKPVLIVAPQNDRFANLPALKEMLRGLPEVTLQTPFDFNRLSPAVRTPAFEWLDRIHTQGR
jgi:dienelactone hydrolase